MPGPFQPRTCRPGDTAPLALRTSIYAHEEKREGPIAREEHQVEAARPEGHRIALGVALFAAAFVVAGCYPKAGSAPAVVSASSVTAASARWPGVTADSLAAGRDIFLANCNGCHSYPDLTAISEDRWPGILEKMATKSHLDAGQRDSVLHFVLASRSDQAAR